MADPQTWQELADAEPTDIIRRTGGTAGTADGITFPFLTGTVSLVPADRAVRVAGAALPGAFVQKFDVPLLAYCLHGEPVRPAGEWVSPKDLPGGHQFFLGGSHNVPVEPLLKRYGTDRHGFETAARAFGGTPLTFGDVSFCLPMLDQVPVAVVLWEGDDEFEPRISMLVDRTAGDRLPLDAVLALLLLTGIGLSIWQPGAEQ